jgi:TldD protein
VTVVDDGTLLGVGGQGRRGSLSIDDEARRRRKTC